MKSHYLHAHKIQDITSKTIRANSRLFEKHKTDNLQEACLLEILSQQNIDNQYTTTVPAIKNELQTEKSKDQHNSELQTYDGVVALSKPTSSSVEDQGQNTNVSVNHNSIKLENSGDVASTNKRKEEACGMISSTADTANVQQQRRVTPKIRNKPNKPAVETVIIVDQQSTQLGDVVVKSEDRLFAFQTFQISELDDGGGGDPIKLECTDNNTSPFLTTAINAQPVNDDDTQAKKCIKIFHCDICPKSYSQKSKLKFHIKSRHTEGGIGIDKRKMCEICGKTYGENSALQKHLKYTHSDDRPFSCEVCGRSFKDSNGLKVSMKCELALL